jgi:putative nucleotidyltransferase with HDIG domain
MSRMPLPSRTESWALLCEYVESESLRKHMLAVETAMRAYARHYGEDEELWGATGLLHDLDYERFPTAEVHPRHAAEVLTARGYPEPLVYAVRAHADYMGLERRSLLDRTLYAVDELSGLVTACVLVRPGRSFEGLDAASVRKKMKDKAFARGVHRESITVGARELGVELDEHINFVIAAIRDRAAELGLGAAGA